MQSFGFADKQEHKEKHAWLALELLKSIEKHSKYIDNYLRHHVEWSTITGEIKRLESHISFTKVLNAIIRTDAYKQKRDESMQEKIADIRKALKSDCLQSALALALTLPDICGKVEFPGQRQQAYIYWFDKYVAPFYPMDPTYPNVYEGTQFDGLACYLLRCSYLHSGNTDLKAQRRKGNRINDFTLCISSSQDSGIYVDKHGIVESSDPGEEKIYSVRLDIRKLIKTLCDVAEAYYDEHKENGAFKDYSIHIINMEAEMKWYSK